MIGQDKGYIGIGIGGSSPLGPFGSTDIDNDDAGFANPGAVFDISFGYKVGKTFGVAALLRGQANPVDAQALAEAFVVPGTSVRVDAGNWGLAGYMFGGYACSPIGAKWDLEGRLLIGFLRANSPTYDITVTNLTTYDYLTLKSTSASSSTFAYAFGGGVRWNVGRRICLLWSIDYLGANPEFEYTFTNTNGVTTKSTSSQPIATLNSAISIGYRFGVSSATPTN